MIKHVSVLADAPHAHAANVPAAIREVKRQVRAALTLHETPPEINGLPTPHCRSPFHGGRIGRLADRLRKRCARRHWGLHALRATARPPWSTTPQPPDGPPNAAGASSAQQAAGADHGRGARRKSPLSSRASTRRARASPRAGQSRAAHMPERGVARRSVGSAARQRAPNRCALLLSMGIVRSGSEASRNRTV